MTLPLIGENFMEIRPKTSKVTDVYTLMQIFISTNVICNYKGQYTYTEIYYGFNQFKMETLFFLTDIVFAILMAHKNIFPKSTGHI